MAKITEINPLRELLLAKAKVREHFLIRLHTGAFALVISWYFLRYEIINILVAVNILGLPGGYRNNNGTFNNIGNNGNWWSSSSNSSTNAWNRNLNYNNTKVNRNNNNKENGFSVRCVRDWKGDLFQ